MVGSLVRPEIHENCMHSAGDVIIWIGGGGGEYNQLVYFCILIPGYTDERVEDVWVSAQPPYDPVPFEGYKTPT